MIMSPPLIWTKETIDLAVSGSSRRWIRERDLRKWGRVTGAGESCALFRSA